MHKRIALVIGSFLVLVGLVALLISAISGTGPASAVTADSGVAACKAMANNMTKSKDTSNTKMTKAKYNEARKPFEKSRHSDIKVAGTNLLATIYKADQMPQDDTDLGKQFGDAMVLMSAVQTNWSALQVACGNHGVTVPALPL